MVMKNLLPIYFYQRNRQQCSFHNVATYFILCFSIIAMLLFQFVAPASAFAQQQSAVASTPDYNANYNEMQSSRIDGFVWVDFNQNSMWEEDEPPLAGETVFITPDIESDFAQVLVLFTNANGEFSANNLSPGRYRIWTVTTGEESAKIVHITADRSVMTVQLPLVGFTLFMPQIVR